MATVDEAGIPRLQSWEVQGGGDVHTGDDTDRSARVGSGKRSGNAESTALLGTHNEIVATAALTLLAGLGDLVPPTALAGIFAAQVVDEENYFAVLRECVIPFVLTAVWAVIILRWSVPLARILVR